MNSALIVLFGLLGVGMVLIIYGTTAKRVWVSAAPICGAAWTSYRFRRRISRIS